MQIIHTLSTTTARLREDANPYAREGMTATRSSSQRSITP